MWAAQFTRRQLVAKLTARELDVMAQVATGASNKEVAAALAISENTVKNHLSTIFAKLGARNRLDALRIAGKVRDFRRTS